MIVTGDSSQSGFFPMQDHRAGVPTNIRLRMAGVRITDDIDDEFSGLGWGKSMGLGTGADFHPFQHWAAPGRGESFGVGAWNNVMPAMVVRGGSDQTVPGTTSRRGAAGGAGGVGAVGVGGAGGGGFQFSPGSTDNPLGSGDTVTGWRRTSGPTSYTRKPPVRKSVDVGGYNSLVNAANETLGYTKSKGIKVYIPPGGTGNVYFGPREDFSRFGPNHPDAQRRRLMEQSADKESGKDGADGAAGGAGDVGNFGPGGAREFKDSPSRVSALPIKDTSWTLDDRFVRRTFDFPKGLGDFPGGTLGLAIAGTKEERQEDLLYYADPRLRAVNFSGEADMASRVYDLDPAGVYSSERWSRLQSMMRVVMLPGFPGIAWQLTTSDQDSLGGQGLVYGTTPPVSSTAATPHPSASVPELSAPTITPSTSNGSWTPSDVGRQLNQLVASVSANAADRAGAYNGSTFVQEAGGGGGGKGSAGGTPCVAFMSTEQGGPLCTGGAEDKHNIGKDGDGNPINSGHIWTDALYYMDDMRDGMQNFTRIPYPKTVDWSIPTNVYLSWDPKIDRWNWWTTVPIMDSPPFDEREPLPEPDPPPTPEEPPPPPPEITPGDVWPDDRGKNPVLPGGGINPGVRGLGGGGGTPGAPGAGGSGNGIAGATVSTAAPPSGKAWPAGHVVNLRLQAASGILARPQNVTDGAADFRRKNRSAEQWYAEDATRPTVLREEAWGALDNGEWDYSETPSESAYNGGVTSGGYCFFPPQIGIEHAARHDMAPAGITLTAAYRAAAPGAWWAAGVPDVSNGDMKDDSYRWGIDSGGDWALQLKASSAWATQVKYDEGENRLECDEFYLTSPRWDDLRFPATGLNPPGGVSDPDRNTTNGLLEFSKSATNLIAGVAQMPHAWKSESDVEAHIHWFGFTAPGANTDVVWKFEYEVVEIGGSWDGSTYSDSAQVTATVTEDTHLYTELKDAISMTGITSVSAMIFWKLSRLGGDASDTYNAVATLGEIDFHYQTDTPGGSTNETSK